MSFLPSLISCYAATKQVKVSGCTNTSYMKLLIHDSSPTQLSNSLSFLSTLLSKDVFKGRLLTTEARYRICTVDTIDALRDVDMVVEPVSENLDLKRRLFRGLRETLNERAILASNTSSISITKIAAAVVPVSAASAEEAGRVVGACYYIVVVGSWRERGLANSR